MKKLPSTLLLTIFCLVITPSTNAGTGSVINKSENFKSACYTQTGPSSEDLVLDPAEPYVFRADAQCAQGNATLITSATLTVPRGTTPMFKARSLGSNIGGVVFEEHFTNKMDMDTAFPMGSNAVIAVNISGKTNYYTNPIELGNYPLPPLIHIDDNGFWSPQGYIIVQNPKQAMTISWPPTKDLQSSLNIGGIISTNSTNVTTFTFSTNLLSQLPTGVIIAIMLDQSISNATVGCNNTFAIYIPPPLFNGDPLFVVKKHHQIQTNTNTLVDYTPKIAPKGDYYLSGYGPYSFDVKGPVSNTIFTPNGLKLYSKVSQGGYKYSSGALKSRSQLDSNFESGVYTFSSGQKLTLTGDVYPDSPRIVAVNGKAPIWSNGMLVLSSTQTNNIVWSSFNAVNASFNDSGVEAIQLYPAAFADMGSYTGQYFGKLVCPPLGLGGTNLVTNHIIQPNYLSKNVNYTMTIGYGVLTSYTNKPFISGAGYISGTIIPIIAQ